MDTREFDAVLRDLRPYRGGWADEMVGRAENECALAKPREGKDAEERYAYALAEAKRWLSLAREMDAQNGLYPTQFGPIVPELVT